MFEMGQLSAYSVEVLKYLHTRDMTTQPRLSATSIYQLNLSKLPRKMVAPSCLMGRRWIGVKCKAFVAMGLGLFKLELSS